MRNKSCVYRRQTAIAAFLGRDETKRAIAPALSETRRVAGHGADLVPCFSLASESMTNGKLRETHAYATPTLKSLALAASDLNRSIAFRNAVNVVNIRNHRGKRERGRNTAVYP